MILSWLRVALGWLPGGRRTAAIGLVGLLGLVALYGYWLGWARPDSYTTADAVIVHAGQRHRLRRANELMANGVAPVLVLLFAEQAYPDDARDLCQDSVSYTVICSNPERSDTMGEAIEINALAREHGWQSVVIVTSDYHLRRARYLDRKCTDIEVLGVAARPKNLMVKLQGVAKEMISMPLSVAGSCR
jgi:uncharacterized SAM-binding protein YcdF (DUF218 family)